MANIRGLSQANVNVREAKLAPDLEQQQLVKFKIRVLGNGYVKCMIQPTGPKRGIARGFFNKHKVLPVKQQLKALETKEHRAAAETAAADGLQLLKFRIKVQKDGSIRCKIRPIGVERSLAKRLKKRWMQPFQRLSAKLRKLMRRKRHQKADRAKAQQPTIKHRQVQRDLGSEEDQLSAAMVVVQISTNANFNSNGTSSMTVGKHSDPDKASRKV